MDSFKTFVVEEKNTHMTHIEELLFLGGVDGTRQAINFLRDLRDMLKGNASSAVDITVKWDGAPAVFAGVDPEDKKFFVAKKGLFAKTPKMYKTNADIENELSVTRSPRKHPPLPQPMTGCWVPGVALRGA